MTFVVGNETRICCYKSQAEHIVSIARVYMCQ